MHNTINIKEYLQYLNIVVTGDWAKEEIDLNSIPFNVATQDV